MRLLRPRDALRHRRLVDEERARDLGRRQAADRAQRQRDRRCRRQRRMAAHEEHGQRVVLVRDVAAPAARCAASALPVSPRAARFATGRSAAARRSGSATPRGLSGTPSRGQCIAAASSASWTASSACVEVAVPARERAEDLRRELAQQVLDTGGTFSARRPRSRGTPPSRRRPRRARPSPAAPGSAAAVGTPSGPGHGREPRRDLDRALLRLDVDDLEAGEPLLELLERAVGDHRRRRAVRGDDLGQVRPGQDLGLDAARRSRPAPCASAR